jgi:hypothetical protein
MDMMDALPPVDSGPYVYCCLPSVFCTLPVSPFGWLVADGWCWFVMREEYCCLLVGCWWLV